MSAFKSTPGFAKFMKFALGLFWSCILGRSFHDESSPITRDKNHLTEPPKCRQKTAVFIAPDGQLYMSVMSAGVYRLAEVIRTPDTNRICAEVT